MDTSLSSYHYDFRPQFGWHFATLWRRNSPSATSCLRLPAWSDIYQIYISFDRELLSFTLWFATLAGANPCIFTQPKRLTFGAELVSDNLLGQCLGGLNFCQSYAKFLLSRSELPSRWGREDNPFVTLALERRCNYQLSYLIYVTTFLPIHHWGEMVQSRFKSGEIRFPVVPNDHWDAFFLSNHQAPPPPSPQKVAQHLCANYSAGEHSADNSPSQSRQYLATCQVLWTWYFCSTLQLARHLGPPDLIFSCEIQLISKGLTNSHWLVFRPPCIIVISSFFSPRFNSAEMVDVNGSLAIRILP